MKKTISILLSLLLFFSTFNYCVYASESTATSVSCQNLYLSEEEVFEYLSYTLNNKELMTEIKSSTSYSPNGAKIKTFNSIDYNEYTNGEYGGMYIDEYGTLVICYKQGSTTLNSVNKSLLKNKNTSNRKLLNENNEVVTTYTIKDVKYSEEDLFQSYEFINDLAKTNDLIETSEIDIINNRVIVGIYNSENLKSIYDELGSNKDIYSFKILENNFEVKNAVTINGTSKIYKSISGGIRTSTPGGWIYNSKLKTYGIVTCGHGWSENDLVYYNNVSFGRIDKRTYDSKNDSSYITLFNNHTYQDNLRDEFNSTTPVVGSTVTLRGYVSGRISGAKVLSNNTSVRCDGLYCSGLIKCNKSVQPGDSGGGAIGGTMDGGRTASIIGINKCTGSGYTYLVKSKVIFDSLKN